MAKFADIDEKGKKVTDAGDDTATYPLPEAIGGREWGPFRNLENVVTEFGEYGVERGKVPVSYTHLTLPTKRIV